jgi:hypothetical protein
MRHVTSTLLVSLVLASFSFVDFASAQVCGGGIIGVGPIGVGVMIPCPPPPPVYVVRPRRVIRPVYIQQPVIVQQQAPRPLPPPPAAIMGPQEQFVPKLTLGLMMDSSSYEDGGLIGGGVYARYLLSQQFAVEGHVGSLSSCTNCNEVAYRTDSRVGVAGLYYLNPVLPVGMNLYVKGGLTVNNITFSNDITWESESISQTNLEVGGGVEWRLAPWLSLNVEVTGMGAVGGEEIGTGPINEQLSPGIPSSGINNGAVNFRLGISTHF